MTLHRVGFGAFALVAVAFVACVGEDPDSNPSGTTPDAGNASSSSGSASDAPVTDGTDPGTDAGVDARRCDPTKPFGDPQPPSDPLNGSTSDEVSLSMTDDELIAVIERDGDILYTSRPSRDVAFPAPTGDNLSAVSTGQYEGSPSLTGDGKTLYFVRVPTSTGNPTLYVAHREDLKESFDPPVEVKIDGVGGATNAGIVGVVKVNRAGSRLHWTCEDCDRTFIADRSGGAYDTFISQRNMASYLVSPAFSGDELTIYFNANTGDGGELVMRYATRTTQGAAFGVNIDMPPNLLTGYLPVHVTPDECVFYMRTTKGSDAGKYDIWEARRPK